MNDELEKMTYPDFLSKYNLPANGDSANKFKFIQKPTKSEGSRERLESRNSFRDEGSESVTKSLEYQLGLDFDKIKKMRGADDLDNLRDYLDEKIRVAVDNPDLKHIKINDLHRLKNDLLYQ